MLLKVGSKGDDVKRLQEKLGLKADGSFGPGTEKAVKEWQAKNGLKADGLVGDGTWSKMFASSEPATPAPAPAPASTVLESGAPLSFVNKIKGHVPDAVFAQIPSACAAFNIITPLRLAHFLAQCGHESGGFRAVSENLNYSAAGLKNTFSKYFPGDASAYARNPEKIASKVYANRMGNGDESSRDGWKFRGRGYIQLTGKANYEKFTKFIGEDCISNPDLVAGKYPLASAAFFFDSNKLWSICDRGADDATVTAVTRRVNGGTIGLADRIKHFREFYQILS